MLIPAGKKRLYVVLDPGIGGDLCKENRMFDQALNAARFKYKHEHWKAPVYLYEESLKRGIQLLTPDIYLGQEQKFKPAIFIQDNLGEPNFTKQLIAAGARPAILMAYEQPLYACRLYFNLEKETRVFDHVLMPKGAGPRVSKRAVFHPWVPPMPYEMGEATASGDFKNRKFLTMIGRNARVHFLRRWYVHFWNRMKPFPSLVDRELYVDRLKAIRFFSDNPEFDLYGYDWDKPVRYTRAYDAGIKKSWRGAPADKLGTLEKYKFCLVFENCIFDGWITEKIFDAFAAGCVPVYWGAPDITEYVPKNCFVDFRDFKNFDKPDYFLKNMDEKTFNRYIENANAFFASSMYAEHWSREKYAKDLIEIFESYCR